MGSQPRSKRHCWECRRRCLVCDFTEPKCRRCSASGIECPGYNDVKPVKFKWLPPGRSKPLIEKFYFYWGLSIRSLRDHLDIEDRRKDDTVIAGILTLLLVDVQLGTALNWRCHLDGLYELIMQRGGFQVMTRSRVLRPLLRCLWVLAVIGNTTCPASDLLTLGLDLDKADFLLKQFREEMSPFHMFPLPLFAEVIKINHLRMCATQYTGAKTDELSQEAYTILQRVRDFSPEQWADSRRSYEDWVLIGRIHQAAVVIYHILSLQSASVLPTTSELISSCAMYGGLLQSLISDGLSSPKTTRFMVWPLIVLGVYAVHARSAMRAFVAKQLPELSRDLGTSVPLTAKHVLELFWGSGGSRWDDCFNRPYVFTMQIAVDTGDLPHSTMEIC
ncbi:hypothetical protein K445DRAFT_73332 [Daldinia sp. EC12]|nr:hypothetical protein K445DRAFT_73332 [Daldinia sp. EC12]